MSIVLGFVNADGIGLTLSAAAAMSAELVEPSAVMSAHWAVVTFKASDANAQLALGSLYIEGIGVRANVATAYKWISLAEGATTGVLAEAARQLKERLDGRLSNEERLAAEAKIAEWKPVRSNN